MPTVWHTYSRNLVYNNEQNRQVMAFIEYTYNNVMKTLMQYWKKCQLRIIIKFHTMNILFCA